MNESLEATGLSLCGVLKLVILHLGSVCLRHRQPQAGLRAAAQQHVSSPSHSFTSWSHNHMGLHWGGCGSPFRGRTGSFHGE